MAMRHIWTSEATIELTGHPLWETTGTSVNSARGAPQFWVTATPNAHSPATIEFLIENHTADPFDPNVAIRYRLDATYGRVVDSGYLNTSNNLVGLWGRLMGEPRTPTTWSLIFKAETLDEWGGHLGFIQLGGDVLRPSHFQDPNDPTEMLADYTGNVLLPEGPGVTVRNMAIDRASDRLFIQWDADGTPYGGAYPWNRVDVYVWSTGVFLHSIYASNVVRQICADPNGFVWLVDLFNRLTLYSYEGVFHGCWHQTGYPLLAADSELDQYCQWAWDAHANRFLMLPLAAPGTLQVLGFTPRTEEALVTEPLPRQVPRRYRATTFFVKASGSGGEPVTGDPAIVSGATSLAVSTDKDGDAVATYTPTAAGAASITFTVGT